MTEDFAFLDPGKLLDGNLDLILARKTPADPVKRYVPQYEFEMRSASDGAPMGWLRFRVGDADTILRYPGHIGYGVNPEFRGRRYAARSLRLIISLARAHSLTKLRITCHPDNMASRRTCELAGAVFHEIVDIPASHEMHWKEGIHIACRYCIAL